MDFATRAQATAAIARYMGPQAGSLGPTVKRVSLTLPQRSPRDRPSRAVLFEGSRQGEPVLVIPGLHYLGPADPRVDRFCRVLASAGKRVLCPHLPDFTTMRVTPRLTDDAERALDLLLQRSPGYERAGLFSISFGVRPALELSIRRASDLTDYVAFGGYADLYETMRFAVNGGGARPHDPLNSCAVFLNLLDEIAPHDPAALSAAWLAFIDRTWGRVELKSQGRHIPIATQLAARVHPQDREIFLMTTRVIEGAGALLEALLTRADLRALEALQFAPKVTIPTLYAHGRDDDVIPYPQAELLAAATPGSELALTGLFGHSGGVSLGDLLRGVRDELSTSWAMVQALVRLGAN